MLSGALNIELKPYIAIIGLVTTTGTPSHLTVTGVRRLRTCATWKCFKKMFKIY